MIGRKIIYRRTFKDDRPYEREFSGIKKFEPISRTHPGLMDILQVGRNDAEGYFIQAIGNYSETVGSAIPDTSLAGNDIVSVQMN